MYATMYPSQKEAIDRIVRYYRDNESDNYAIDWRVEEDRPRFSTLYVNARWLGRENQLGAVCEAKGVFLIGPRGKITVISAYGGYYGTTDNTTHVAFMLRAKVGYGSKKPPVRRPSRYRGKGKTAKVWEIADANSDKTRAEVIALCVNQGVNKNTAQTQYQHWLNQQKMMGRR